jgi:hypothetical protein
MIEGQTIGTRKTIAFASHPLDPGKNRARIEKRIRTRTIEACAAIEIDSGVGGLPMTGTDRNGIIETTMTTAGRRGASAAVRPNPKVSASSI